MPGPAPKMDPIRRNARTGPLSLPASGRKGDPPPWPLPGQTEAEEKAWPELWATPQAVAWETLGWTRTVARYCRCMVDSELPGAPVTLLGEVRQLEDRLGLTPMSMRRLLWQIAPDELAAKRDERKDGKSARTRLRAVDAV